MPGSILATSTSSPGPSPSLRQSTSNSNCCHILHHQPTLNHCCMFTWRTWPRVGEEIAHGYRRLAWFLMRKTASAEDKGSVGQNMDEYGGTGCQGQSVRVLETLQYGYRWPKYIQVQHAHRYPPSKQRGLCMANEKAGLTEGHTNEWAHEHYQRECACDGAARDYNMRTSAGNLGSGPG